MDRPPRRRRGFPTAVRDEETNYAQQNLREGKYYGGEKKIERLVNDSLRSSDGVDNTEQNPDTAPEHVGYG